MTNDNSDMSEQLTDLCQEFDIRCEAEIDKNVGPLLDKGMTGWRVFLTNGRTSATILTDFLTGRPDMPLAADVLYSLLSEVNGISDGPITSTLRSFEEWCSDLGYDTDSRKALRTYEACVTMMAPLKTFLGDLYDRFARAEH